jgi:Predicted membrane protein (DUF2078).
VSTAGRNTESPEPFDQLKQQYVGGEIDREEFERHLDEQLQHGTPGAGKASAVARDTKTVEREK